MFGSARVTRAVWGIVALVAAVLVPAVAEVPGAAADASVQTTAGSVTLGAEHACAVSASGGVQCWGSNSAGQLGDGGTTSRSTPAPVTGLGSGVVQVSAGLAHTCAVTASGGARCWGRGASGQLGATNPPNSSVSSSTPVDVLGLTSGVVGVAAGDNHSCAVTAAGAATCWGSNGSGQLGRTASSPSLAATVSGLGSGVAAVTAGSSFSCALLVDRTVRCWGANGSGQLGNGGTSSSDQPVAVAGLSDVIAISSGAAHTCAVTAAGAVRCWGANGSGRLGDGTTTSSSTPVGVVGLSSGVRSVAAGGSTSCALLTSGAVRCWGYNGTGALGDGTATTSSVPVSVTGLGGGSGAVAVAAGGDASACALLATGSLRCWGRNLSGQLGNDSSTSQLVPTAVPGLGTTMAAVGAGGTETCGVTSAGGVKCWGAGLNGELGNGTTAASTLPGPPVDVSGLSAGVTAVSVGSAHACALTSAGAVRCWGSNDSGRLGNGSTTSSSVPVPVTGLAAGATQVAAGGTSTCAVTAVGGVKCWGSNGSGQLGNGTLTSSSTPVDVTGLTSGVLSVAVGSAHACALTAAGGVKCWGSNGSGRLGDGTAAARAQTPVDVVGLGSGVSAIAVGSSHSCAATSTGVSCWGSNTSGQLGNNSLLDSNVPEPVIDLPAPASIDADNSQTCARSTEGTVSCWGADTFGQLGDGQRVPSARVPVAVSGLTGVASLAVGGQHVCARTTVGGISCWGLGSSGELGTVPAPYVPAEVPAGTRFGPIAAPTITAQRTPAANSAGWNNEPVTVSFTCESAILASCTAPVTVATDGADRSVTGTATDLDGGSASTTVEGISIDRVAPTIAGTATTPPNAAGWYRAPVTMTWTCDDDRSGVAPGACPSPSSVSGEGSGLTVSQSVTDRAGNSATGSSEAVNIDLTRPSTGVSSPPTWSRAAVTLSLTASDALSGVAATHFQVDGGPLQTGTAPVVAGEGHHVVTYWSVDNAGNVEAPASVDVAIDVTAPSIVGTVSPAPNANGWNNGDVTVSFTCGDATSGVASCSAPTHFTTEVDTTVTGTAADAAGNTASDQVPVRIDRTPPTATALVPPANPNGWFSASVQVPFSCIDTGGSGVDTCPAPLLFSGEGAGQAVTGSATDNAGNIGSASGATVSLDLTAPVITGAAVTGSNGDGGYYGDVTVRWTCTDALSGVAACPPDQVISGEGVHTVVASASDRAGNTSSAEVTVRIDHDPRTDPGFVHGTITDASNGQPVRNASVSLTTTQGVVAYRTKTGTDGTYTIPIVADGSYRLLAKNDGVNLPAWYPNATRESDASVLVVAHGSNITADQALEPGYVLQGRLISGLTGQPVAGATVRVQGGGADYSAASNADGEYAVTGMLAGSRTVTIIAYGYTVATVPVVVPAVTTLDRALAPASASNGLKGTITALTLGGSPLSGATVRVWPKGSKAVGITATTGSNGRFALPGVPQGTYEIDVVRADYRARWYADSAERLTASALTLGAACTSSPDPAWGDPCATSIAIRMLKP